MREIQDTPDGLPASNVTAAKKAPSAHRAKKRPYVRKAAPSPPAAETYEFDVDEPPATVREMRLVRKHKGDVDPFYIDPADIPPGMSFQFVCETVYGQPNTAHLLQMKGNHWKPVMASRYPGKYMPDDYTGPIRRGEQMLMERPKYLTEEAEREDYLKALDQVSSQEERLQIAPNGTGPRTHSEARPNIRRSSSAVPVTD